jgi:hypothetical protein
MRFRMRRRAASVVMAPLLMVVALGCSERLPAGPQAALAPRQSPDFFTAAVSHFARKTGVPILVDPRPLRPEARLNSVTDADLLPSEAETIRMRTRVIESAGWRTADAPADWRCVFSQAPRPPDAPPEPDSLRLRYQPCRERGPYEILVFGLPQSGTDPDHPSRWRIRTMRMLPYGYEVVDLFLEKSPSGEWTVVADRVRSGVFS